MCVYIVLFFVLSYVLLLFFQICFLVRDKKYRYLWQRRKVGTWRSRGRGNHNQDILCGKKNLFSIKKKCPEKKI